MGYVVSALNSYTNEDANKLIVNELFTGSALMDAAMKSSNLMTGVKSAETINIVSTTPITQSQACSLSPSGSTTYSQRTVTVGKPKWDLSWCERDLEPKYTQKAMTKGGNYDALTYINELKMDVAQQIKVILRKALWQGDTTSWNSDLNQFDGLAKLINNGVIGGTYSGTTWSVANSRTAVQGLVALVVAADNVYFDGETKLKAYASPSTVFNYRQKLLIDNLYHIDPTNPKQEIFLEGTSIPLVSDPGLTGTTAGTIYVIEDDNIHAATDLENEDEKFDIWFSKDDQKIYFHAETKLGINYGIGSRIFKYLGV